MLLVGLLWVGKSAAAQSDETTAVCNKRYLYCWENQAESTPRALRVSLAPINRRRPQFWVLQRQARETVGG